MKNTVAEGTKAQIGILIVDDEPSVGDALKLVLQSSGYDVVLVTKGRNGIEQARRQRFGFSIVDLFLSDICGLEVIEQIHLHEPALPILLVTGHGDPRVFAEAQRLGAIGGLSKPFQPADILRLINSALAS